MTQIIANGVTLVKHFENHDNFVFTRNEVVAEGGVPEVGEVGVPPALR